MSTDFGRGGDRFRPKLGKVRSRGDKAGSAYLKRVMNAVGRARSHGPKHRTGRTFSGGVIVRGGAAMRSASNAAGARRSGFTRRVVIKTRLIKLAGQGKALAKAHLRYIQRDGVTKDGERGRLYDADDDQADGDGFVKRCASDRHQFRFIVSPEDADQLEDLKAYTRDLMRQMQDDLGTKLEWVAIDHHNTGHPHTHVVLRGKDDGGRDLVIAKDYIRHGMRQRAEELATLELGPPTELEIQEKLRREVEQDRLTSLDRRLLNDIDDDVIDTRVEPSSAYARFRHSLQVGRLRTLERMQLAEEVEPGRWHLHDQLEERLRALGRRGDIINTMHREMSARGLERSAVDYQIFNPRESDQEMVVGRIVSAGLADELYDRHYLIVDGIDGRTHYVDIGRQDDLSDFRQDAIVSVAGRSGQPRPVDRTIARIARHNDGRYSIDAHRSMDPRTSEDYARTHVRRLELLRRAGVTERLSAGSWKVPGDFLDRVATFEQRQATRNPVTIQVLSSFSLEKQIKADGATWLDRQLLGRGSAAVRDAGFGHQVEQALERRRQHLLEQGLASERGGQTSYRANLLALLRRREIQRVGGELAEKTGLPFHEAQDGDRVEGTYRRSVILASAKYALIERAHEFTLVPWRAVLERSRDQHVSGVMRGQSISWTLIRQRELARA